jgi:phospholipid/cholesterol/gamma-HCH transport system ATP-binding protein
LSIEIRDLHKSFGGKQVLKGFSLTVDEGETLSVIGHSGAGKSVMLKTILGLIRPDRGEVWVDGKNVHALDRDALYELRRQVGYVFQFAALFDSMTIRENVAMGLRRIKTMAEGEIQHRVSACLYLVDLQGVEDKQPSELSGGMRKRAGLARAIATQPKYLLYDEPTSGLDPVITTTIDDLIIRMADELSVTGIVVTHDMTSAYRISDRIAMLHEGGIRWIGTPEQIRASDDPVVRGFVEGRPELMHREHAADAHPGLETR